MAANVPWNRAGIARFPVPHATSRTFMPDRIPNRSTNSAAFLAVYLAILPKSPVLHVVRSVVLAACCRVRAFALVVLTDVVADRVALTFGEEIIFPLFRKYTLWTVLDSRSRFLDGGVDAEVRRSPRRVDFPSGLVFARGTGNVIYSEHECGTASWRDAIQ
jgi:hypothetical protein